MKNTPIWAFHGDEDNMVDVKGSRRMIAAIKHAGGKSRYTEYQGVGHNAWQRAFAEPDFCRGYFRKAEINENEIRRFAGFDRRHRSNHL